MTNRNKIVLATVGLLLIIVAVRLWFGFRSQPQLPPRAEVFKTVDALFTAVTARDEQRLAACEMRLNKFVSSGELPAAAAKRLSGVIVTARAGQWESAAHRLYDFMQAQRREGKPAASLPQATLPRTTAMNAPPVVGTR